MSRSAVFFDRDGTLIEDRGHISDPGEAVFFPGTVQALRRLQEHFPLFIVTNQSGLSRNILRAKDVDRVNRNLVRRLAGEGVTIQELYCCPHAREDGCSCVKPNPYFLLKAARDHGIDLRRSFVVGDHPSDVELAANVSARAIYVLSGHGHRHRSELAVPCTVVRDIGAAADAIACLVGAQILRRGGLVAFPTETVYGLGADARNAAAVQRIFAVKARPSTHPLIVHFDDVSALTKWAVEIPELAFRLAEHFWPGPLTMILRRSSRVPAAVTGGQETVGLRVPAQPLALQLLSEFGGAVAAPSANRFGRVSPTSADHVRADLGAEVDFVVDGGPCTVGIESTIVDLSDGDPSILRPGGLTREEIEQVVRCSIRVRETGVRAPGSFAVHYAPRADVRIVAAEQLAEQAELLKARGLRVEILKPAAHTLYASLREADQRGVEVLLVSLPPEEGLGLAVADRLRRAAGRGPGSR